MKTCPYIQHYSEKKINILERKVSSPEREWTVGAGQDAAGLGHCLYWATLTPTAPEGAMQKLVYVSKAYHVTQKVCELISGTRKAGRLDYDFAA